MTKLVYNKDQFKNDEEYKKFLEEKWQSLKKKLEEPEIKAVFKRLADR
jgi:hypothetical protein